MNAQTEIVSSPLAKLRDPFPDHHISKLPKPSKAQTEMVKADYKKGIRCTQCGSWHHPDVVHLDYVGHAALTDRLLDTDPHWTWEPLAFTDLGLPAFDQSGGLWIKLTVCGVTRLGYGHAAAKAGVDPGAREKEVIGDALRNAAMRFGAALDLWHKGVLHIDDGDEAVASTSQQEPTSPSKQEQPDQHARILAWVDKVKAELKAFKVGDDDLLTAYLDKKKVRLDDLKNKNPSLHAEIDHAIGLARATTGDVPF